MFPPSQKAQDEASGCADYQARLGLLDRLQPNWGRKCFHGHDYFSKGAKFVSVSEQMWPHVSLPCDFGVFNKDAELLHQ
jgi:hypothetical protein